MKETGTNNMMMMTMMMKEGYLIVTGVITTIIPKGEKVGS